MSSPAARFASALKSIQALDSATVAGRAAASSALADMTGALRANFEANGHGTPPDFELEALALPCLIEKWGFQVPESGAWDRLYLNLAKSAAAQKYDVKSLLTLLAVEGVISGCGIALAAFLERIAESSIVDLFGRGALDPAKLGRVLGHWGWYDSASVVANEDVARVVKDVLVPKCLSDGEGDIFALVSVLDYAIPRSSHWLDFVTSSVLLPTMLAAAQNVTLANAAIRAESLAYSVVLKKTDTAENFKRFYEQLAPALAAAGASFGRARFDPGTLSRPEIGAAPRVAFFVLGDFTTAHVQVMYAVLQGLAKLPSPPIRPLVYVWEPPGRNLDYLVRRVEGMGVTVRHLDRKLEGAADGVAWLRRQSDADGIAAVVFVGITIGLCFAAAARVAPVTIWWSLKYHSLSLPEIDGYLACMMFQHRPPGLGPHWRIADTVVPFGVDRALSAEAAELRTKFAPAKGKVILGCLGRAEKLVDPRYAAMLGRVMRAHPNTVYIWTGRNQRPEFVARLEQEGIQDRCHFVGWINVKLYAQVLDIKLDSFPFASGHTCVEVMAAGKPVITLLTPESIETSTATSFLPLYRGEAGTPDDHAAIRAMFESPVHQSLVPFVDSIDAYERLASRLIRDPGFRAAVGAACQAFVERFLGNDARCAATMGEQINAILHEHRSRFGV